MARMLAVGCLSFAVSAVLIFTLGHYTPRIDSADYENIARSIVNGHGIATTAVDPRTGRLFTAPDTFRPPLYPVALSPAFAIGGLRLARLWTAAFGAVAVMLLFALVRELWGERPALVAGALAAVYPPLLICNVSLLTEPLFLCFELAALLGLLRFRRQPSGLGWPVTIGVSVGLASLARSNGLAILPLAMLTVWWACKDRRRGTAAAAVTLAAAALTLAPWIVRNEVVLGHFVPTTSEAGYSLITVLNDNSRAHGGEPDDNVWGPDIASAAGVSEQQLAEPAVWFGLDGVKIGQKLLGKSVRYIWAHPGYAVWASALNTLRTLDLVHGEYTGFGPYGTIGVPRSRIWSLLLPATYLVYALALLGAVALVRRRELLRPPLSLYVIPVVLVVSTGLVAGAMRYRVPLDPLLLAFAGLGLSAWSSRLTALARPRKLVHGRV
jgi:hypothetical protein